MWRMEGMGQSALRSFSHKGIARVADVHALARRLALRARSSSIADNTRSGVAGASRRGASLWSTRLAMASLIASQTEIANISGGSPIALERKIVAARFGASLSSRTLKIGGTSRLPGIL